MCSQFRLTAPRKEISGARFDRWGNQMVPTSMPRRFLHRTHLLNPGRQYSTKYSSVYSTPWPLPNLPCVLADVSKRGVCKFTSRYSLPSFVTIYFGHHAPPPLSCRSLQNRRIIRRELLRALLREVYVAWRHAMRNVYSERDIRVTNAQARYAFLAARKSRRPSSVAKKEAIKIISKRRRCMYISWLSSIYYVADIINEFPRPGFLSRSTAARV